MNQCKCGSFAINHNAHGRDGSDSHLCDVCYWRERAESTNKRIEIDLESSAMISKIRSAVRNLDENELLGGIVRTIIRKGDKNG